MNYRPFGVFTLSVAVLGGSFAVPAASSAATSAQLYNGAEGAVGANNTSTTGGAVEGTVATSGDTSVTIPFGALGEYLASTSTFGIGIAGISTSGYAVGAEVLGTNPALFAESLGSGPALQLATTSSSATALTVVSKTSTALTIETQHGGYGLEATADNGEALQATGNTAAEFSSVGNGNGYAFLGLQNGIGVAAYGNDTTSSKLPALLAQARSLYSNVFKGYNSTGTLAFNIENGTNGDSDIGPSDGSDVSIVGDLYITGGLYECLPSDGGCSTIGATAPRIPDTHTREGGHVRTYYSQTRTATIEDFGSGRVTNGSAYVRLDPALTSILAGRSSYLVYLTPGGDSHGLYYSNRSSAGFEVHDGNARSALEFSYRIVVPRAAVAKRAESQPITAIASRIKMPAARLRSAPTAPRSARPSAPNAAFVALLHRRTASARRDTSPSSTAHLVPGSEGAVAYNNTATAGAALEGTVASAGNTSEAIPFGLFAEYTISNSTFGAGALGISKSGYAVAAEAFGNNAAILGLNAASANGIGMQVVSSSVGQGMQVQSAGAGMTLTAGGAGYGIQATSEGGQNAVYVTSTNGTAATFTSNYVKSGGQGSGGQAILGEMSGTGIAALGYDNGATHYPALLAESMQGGDIFDGYNANATSAVFQIQGSTQNYSGLAPSNGTDVTIYGDFFVTGGIYQCSGGGSSCTEVTASTDAQERQSEPTVEDSGDATLERGTAYVRLDPRFVDTMSRTAPYLVFLTPSGDSATLYYANRTPEGFTVRESEGGRSNVAFSYRIVAAPAGASQPRFPVQKAIAGPPRKPRVADTRATTPFWRLNIHPQPLTTLARIHAALGGR